MSKSVRHFLDISELPPGEQIVYRARFESLESPGVFSEPASGRFRTAPWGPRRLRVVWSGDTVGQGWGIDPARGGRDDEAGEDGEDARDGDRLLLGLQPDLARTRGADPCATRMALRGVLGNVEIREIDNDLSMRDVGSVTIDTS